MTTFAGVSIPAVLFGPLAGRSAELDQLDAPAPELALSLGFRKGPKSGTGAVAISAPAAHAGTLAPTYASELRHKIIVVPRQKNLGFIFNDQHLTVEVWNNYPAAQTLQTITVSGPDGITVSNSYTLPASMPTSASYLFTVNALVDGGPVIQNTVTWGFMGGISGTDLTLNGIRLVPFPISPDWGQGIIEHYGYNTQLITSYDGTEQRIQLTATPARALEFTAMTETAVDVAILTALMYGWQSKVFGVPIWMDMQQAGAALAPGGTVITVDTTNMDLGSGLVMLWSNSQTWEAFAIDSSTSSSITVTSPANDAWPINSWVIPLRNGRMQLKQPVSYMTPDLAVVALNFALELIQ